MVERRLERRHDRVEPRQRALVRRLRRHAGGRAHRRHDRHLVARRVEHDHDGRADQQRLRHADRIGLGRREPLHPAHHVVAEIAEHARRHRRQARRQLDPRLVEKRPQRLQRIAWAGRESVGIDQGAAVDLGPIAGRAKDEVGVEADHRIAPALRAALDRLEQEHVARATARELEIGRDGSFEVGDERRHRDARRAGLIGAREGLEVRDHRHRRFAMGDQPPSADCRISGCTTTPSERRSASTYCSSRLSRVEQRPVAGPSP